MQTDDTLQFADAHICVFAPWPLFTVTVERLHADRDEVYFNPGGQAVWVARMIGGLGARPTLVGPFGGEARVVLEAMIRAEDIGLRAVPVRGSNGGYLNDRRDGSRETIAEVEPPRLDRHEVDDVYNAVLSESLRAGTAVVTGVPDGAVLPVETYGRLVNDLKANGIAVVADVAGTVLAAIESGLTTLKVSHEEMQAAGLISGDSTKTIIKGMERLREKAENVVVSRAGAGCLALMDGELLEATGPELQALDPTGAGDSMTAALAVACAAKLDPSDALRLATAAGALNVTRRGRGTGRIDDILALADRVQIERLGGKA